jgi:hypothetical protein
MHVQLHVCLIFADDQKYFGLFHIYFILVYSDEEELFLTSTLVKHYQENIIGAT